MSPACQGLIFVICFAASRQGGGESLPDDGEMAGRMRPSRDHITPNTAHTAQGDPPSPTAPLSWTQRLKRVFRIDIEGCPQYGARLRIIACIETPEHIQTSLSHLAAGEHSGGHRARAAPPNAGGLDPTTSRSLTEPSARRASTLCRRQHVPRWQRILDPDPSDRGRTDHRDTLPATQFDGLFSLFSRRTAAGRHRHNLFNVPKAGRARWCSFKPAGNTTSRSCGPARSRPLTTLCSSRRHRR